MNRVKAGSAADIKLDICSSVVRQERHDQEMSLREFASELGVTRQTVLDWENKKYKPGVATLVRIGNENKEGSWQWKMADRLISVLLSSVRI